MRGFRSVSGTAALLCLALSSFAETTWVEVKSPHFTIVGNAGENNAQGLARRFERFRQAFQKRNNARVDSGKPFVIFACRDEDTMKSLIPSFWTTKGHIHPAGVFLGTSDKEYAVVRVDSPEEEQTRVIFHEYTHLLETLNFSWLPVWLNEGLADFYASADFRDDSVTWGRLTPWHVRLLSERSLMPLRTVMHVDQGSSEYNQAAHGVTLFYAESALLTDFLILGDPKHPGDKIVKFLQLVQQDVSEDEALVEAFGDLNKLQADFLYYAKRPVVNGQRFSLPPLGVDLTTRKLSPAEVASLQAEFYAHAGYPKEAEAALEEALRQDPALPAAFEAKGLLFLSRGGNKQVREQAIEAFTQAARLAPEDFAPHYYLGTLTLSSLPAAEGALPPERVDGEGELRRALALNPIFEPTLARLARWRLDRGTNVEEGLSMAVRAYALLPGDWSNALTLARLLMKSGKADLVLTVETRLVREARGNPAAIASVASFVKERHGVEEALAFMRRSAQLHPTNPVILTRAAQFLESNDRRDESEPLYRKVLEIDPKSEMALNALAYRAAQDGVRLEEALAFVDRALVIRPGEPNYLDTRAWVLFRLGRFAEAEQVLREAIVRDPDVVMLDHLGDVLATQGKRADANAQWRRALESWRIAAELKKSIQEKLDSAGPRVPTSPPP